MITLNVKTTESRCKECFLLHQNILHGATGKMARVYYCEGCREKHGFPETSSIKEKRCSYCREVDDCYIADSANLPAIKAPPVIKPQQTGPKKDKTASTRSHISIGDDEKDDVVVDFLSGGKKVREEAKPPTKEIMELTADRAREMLLEINNKKKDEILAGILNRIFLSVADGSIEEDFSGMNEVVAQSVVKELTDKGFDTSSNPEKRTVKVKW